MTASASTAISSSTAAIRTYLFAFCAWAEQRRYHPQLRWSWRRSLQFARDVEPLNRHSCVAYMVHCLYTARYHVIPDEEVEE